MVDIILSFIVGLIGGVLSSWIFLLFVTKYYRPKIIISDKIAYDKTELKYWFKLINKTNRDLYDINIFRS